MSLLALMWCLDLPLYDFYHYFFLNLFSDWLVHMVEILSSLAHYFHFGDVNFVHHKIIQNLYLMIFHYHLEVLCFLILIQNDQFCLN